MKEILPHTCSYGKMKRKTFGNTERHLFKCRLSFCLRMRSHFYGYCHSYYRLLFDGNTHIPIRHIYIHILYICTRVLMTFSSRKLANDLRTHTSHFVRSSSASFSTHTAIDWYIQSTRNYVYLPLRGFPLFRVAFLPKSVL